MIFAMFNYQEAIYIYIYIYVYIYVYIYDASWSPPEAQLTWIMKFGMMRWNLLPWVVGFV